MRTYVPLVFVVLTPCVMAEPLPRYLNSNEMMQTLPTPTCQ